MNPKHIVAAGYDEIATTYLEWSGLIVDDPRFRLLDELMSRLRPGASVLDLGCGAGIPCTKLLAEQHDVLGVDLSGTQIELARANVPDAQFVQGDMTMLDFADHTFDAVTAFYSVLHVPKPEQPGLFAEIARWLKPGGLFLAALGQGTDDVVETWLGTTMYFSSHTPDTNRKLLTDAGFDLIADEVITMREPEGNATFHWILGATG